MSRNAQAAFRCCEVGLRGRHTLQVREGRTSSAAQAFEVADGEAAAFGCTGKRFLPLFRLSFAVPRLALVLVRE